MVIFSPTLSTSSPRFHFGQYQKQKQILHCVHDDNDKLNATQLIPYAVQQ